MWWQGEEMMPPLVSKCYHQLQDIVGLKTEIFLITENNWMRYVDIPDYIIEKTKSGMITITQLSDIIRALLLSKWGGFWIDAAIYVQKLPDDLLDYDLYTLHAPDMFPEFLSRGAWIPGLFYCKYRDYYLFKCLAALFLEYWKEQEKLIEYLLVDYFIMMIIKYDETTKKIINGLPENRNFYEMRLRMNDTYNESEYEKITQKSPFHSLTYKIDLTEKTENGELTNYGHFLKV